MRGDSGVASGVAVRGDSGVVGELLVYQSFIAGVSAPYH